MEEEQETEKTVGAKKDTPGHTICFQELSFTYFENGRIVEQGNYQELLKKAGKFHEIYQLQEQMNNKAIRD